MKEFLLDVNAFLEPDAWIVTCMRFAPYACSVRAFNIAGTGPVSPEVNASSSQFPLNGLASATNAAPYGGPLTLTASIY